MEIVGIPGPAWVGTTVEELSLFFLGVKEVNLVSRFLIHRINDLTFVTHSKSPSWASDFEFDCLGFSWSTPDFNLLCVLVTLHKDSFHFELKLLHQSL